MLNDLFALFRNDILSGSIYIIIALVVLFGIFKCIFPVLHNASLLMRGVRRLEKSHASGGRPVWQEPQFLGRSLQLHWQRFLLNAQHLDMRGIPCNTSDYINEESIVYIPGHAQFGEMIPTLLTSLGILGTFIGLSQGLGTLNISTAEQTILSIPNLLDGMKFAFNTSIVGIACSLGFNMTNRIVIGHAFKAIDAFDEAFYELAMPRPLDPTVQLICQNQDSTAMIKNTADGMRASFAGSIEQVMNKTLSPVAKSMDQFIVAATSQQVEGVDRIINNFISGMNHSLHNQFAKFSETLSIVNKTNVLSFDSMQKNVEAAQRISADLEQINLASREIIGVMSEYIHKQKSAIGEADEGFKNNMLSALSTIQRSMDEQSEFMSNLREYRDLLQKDYGGYIKKSEDLARAIAKGNRAHSDEIKNIANETEQSMKNIVRNYSAAAAQISEGLKSTMERFSHDFANIARLVESHEQR